MIENKEFKGQAAQERKSAIDRVYREWSKLGGVQEQTDRMLNIMANEAQLAEEEVYALQCAMQNIDKMADVDVPDGYLVTANPMRESFRKKHGYAALERLLSVAEWNLDDKIKRLRQWPWNVEGNTPERIFTPDDSAGKQA